MFPLSICFLPGEVVPLHIFETRYKQLISHCQKEQIPFGIPYSQHHTMGPLGTLVQIERINKTYDDGSLDIEVRGISIFEIDEFQSSSNVEVYSEAQIHVLENPKPIDDLGLLAMMHNYLELLQHNKHKNKAMLDVYALAHYLDLSSGEKYELISQQNETRKEQYVKQITKWKLHLLQLEIDLKQSFIFN